MYEIALLLYIAVSFAFFVIGTLSCRDRYGDHMMTEGFILAMIWPILLITIGAILICGWYRNEH